MRFRFAFAKAVILVSILLLISLVVLNKVIQNDRIAIFQKYSNITLPPNYTVVQNAAGSGNYRTSVRLIFRFDEENYVWFLRRNNLDNITPNRTKQNGWVKQGNILTRKRVPDEQTMVFEIVDTRQKTLAFRYQKE